MLNPFYIYPLFLSYSQLKPLLIPFLPAYHPILCLNRVLRLPPLLVS